jgi:hypothetical protein
MATMPPLPNIPVSSGVGVVNITSQPVPTQSVQPVPAQPVQPAPIQPLPQIVTSPTPQPSIQIPTTQVQLPTQLPTLQLPTTRVKSVPSLKINLPKVKATAALPTPTSPGIPGVPQIKLPTMTTVMKPVALTSPVAVSQKEETGLAVAYTPQQQVVENIMKIDPARLNPKRARKDDNSYTVKQLRAIAGSINLPKSGNKKELVDRIKAQILKVNPNAFSQ